MIKHRFKTRADSFFFIWLVGSTLCFLSDFILDLVLLVERNFSSRMFSAQHSVDDNDWDTNRQILINAVIPFLNWSFVRSDLKQASPNDPMLWATCRIDWGPNLLLDFRPDWENVEECRCFLLSSCLIKFIRNSSQSPSKEMNVCGLAFHALNWLKTTLDHLSQAL